MIQDNKLLLSNGLYVSNDWMSFTVMQYSNVLDVIEFMGFSSDDFKELPTGGNGYKRRLQHLTADTIKIYFDGASENMGVHVDVSGGAIATLLETYGNKFLVSTPFGNARQVEDFEETILEHLIKDILEIGHFTRLDLAIDDFGSNYYTTMDLIEKRDSMSIVSRFRRVKNLENDTLAKERRGHTVYFGSKESEIMLRVYDKQLEQNEGLSPDSGNFIHTPWTRWELQLRGERATQTAKHLANGTNIGSVAIGILSNYFRIIQHDDSNRSRCSNENKWDLFVNEVEKLGLTVHKCEKTMEVKERALEQQYGGRMAALFYANGGDMNYFNNMAERNRHRISASDWEQLRKECPELYEQLQDAI